MQHIPVSSSNLRSVAYDSRSQTLEVAFHSGGVYQYYGVPYHIYNGLMTAPSHGKYLWRHIRDRYSYSRVG
jgi:hypothetical protein